MSRIPVKVRQAVADRDNDECRRCGAPGQEIHHRMPRGMGGTSKPDEHDLARCVLLCADCHRWAEHNRADATAKGWLVRHGVERPEFIPLTDLFGRSFLLSRSGAVISQDVPWQ